MAEINLDNVVVLHGKMIEFDFTKTYMQIKDTNRTVCEIPISVYNPENKNKKYKNDLFFVTFYGNKIDEKHPNGGLLEVFLSTIKTKCYVTIYAHLRMDNFLYQNGKKGSKVRIIADTFKIDNVSLDIKKNVENTFKDITPNKSKKRDYESILDDEAEDDIDSGELS